MNQKKNVITNQELMLEQFEAIMESSIVEANRFEVWHNRSKMKLQS